MAIYALGDDIPDIDPTAWVAETAVVIGRVKLGPRVSVWYGSILRGDTERLELGRDCNVQDACVLHADPGLPLILEDEVSVGHQVMLHGCTIGAGSLIGIQAVVLNGARIGRNSIVGAGSLVTEGKEFPDGSLVIGSPAKVARALSEEQKARLAHTAPHYVSNAARHRAGLRRIG
jgi:carbonic anhydrase/acetyltransferase-like protein (isoleucine patch superfamily)